MKSCLRLALLALVPFSSLAQSLPSDEEFRQWDARFKPGIYDIHEYALDDEGKPQLEGAKSRQVCLKGMELMLTARSTPVADPMESCDLQRIRLEGHSFAISYSCGVHEESKKPVVGVIVTREVQTGTFLSSVMKHTVDAGKPSIKPVFGKGYAYEYQGPCK